MVDCCRRVAHGVALHAGAREVRQRRHSVGIGAVQFVLHGNRMVRLRPWREHVRRDLVIVAGLALCLVGDHLAAPVARDHGQRLGGNRFAQGVAAHDIGDEAGELRAGARQDSC